MARYKYRARHKNVNADGFAKAIQEVLAEYGDDVVNTLNEVMPKVADEACDKLRNSTNTGITNWVEYRAGWVVTQNVGAYSIRNTVHNETKYQLTHLLEYSHPMPQGGSSRAYEHIAPVNEWVHEEVVKKVEEALNDL